MQIALHLNSVTIQILFLFLLFSDFLYAHANSYFMETRFSGKQLHSKIRKCLTGEIFHQFQNNLIHVKAQIFL